MNFNRKFKLTLALLSVVVLSSCSGEQQETVQIPEFEVLTVSQEDAILETAIPATLHGKNDVEIRPQISGFLTKVNVKEGQKVNKGQTLFTIDQVELQAAVNSAQAAVEVARANVNTARTNMQNDKILYETKGDNNNISDRNLVNYDDIEGKLIQKISNLGKLVLLLKNKIVIIIILVIFYIMYIHNMNVEEKRLIRKEKRRVLKELYKK